MTEVTGARAWRGAPWAAAAGSTARPRPSSARATGGPRVSSGGRPRARREGGALVRVRREQGRGGRQGRGRGAAHLGRRLRDRRLDLDLHLRATGGPRVSSGGAASSAARGGRTRACASRAGARGATGARAWRGAPLRPQLHQQENWSLYQSDESSSAWKAPATAGSAPSSSSSICRQQTPRVCQPNAAEAGTEAHANARGFARAEVGRR